MRKKKSLFKRIIIIGLVVYVGYIMINQQITLSYYKSRQEYYLNQIEKEKKIISNLKSMKLLYGTDVYIEDIARDKLGFVYPDEKVFIDMADE